MKGFYLSVFMIAALLFVVVWHAVAPQEWRWLAEEEVWDCSCAAMGAIVGVTAMLYLARKIERNSNAG